MVILVQSLVSIWPAGKIGSDATTNRPRFLVEEFVSQGGL